MSTSYDRLSATDSALLTFETPESHMHVGMVATFDAGALGVPGGGVDSARMRAHLASCLHLIPRYRQRLAWIPIEGHPAWVDADEVDLEYHVRHMSLLAPGSEEQLKEVAGDILSRPLDRSRPLWEIWIVDGLEGGRFALVIKVHHCLADGVSGTDALFSVVMSQTPEQTVEPGPEWTPRPAPGPLGLAWGAAVRRARLPLELARTLLDALQEPRRAASELLARLSAVGYTVRHALPRLARAPLGESLGPDRRFEYHTLDLAAVKAVKEHLGGSVNDVALTTVAGAMGQFLRHRRERIDALDYRIMVPANLRPPDQPGATGIHVSGWLMSLPIQERSARRRHARVLAQTGYLKESKQILGPETLFRLGELVGPPLLPLGVRLASWLRPYDLIVTNIPGPREPFYLLGAPMLAAYPVCPLFENQALSIALLSYNGKLFIGLNADRHHLPDLPRLVEDVATSFGKLHAAALAQKARRARARARQHVARVTTSAAASAARLGRS
jgi:WS/DGAT/MGAT family acyltransferase